MKIRFLSSVPCADDRRRILRYHRRFRAVCRNIAERQPFCLFFPAERITSRRFFKRSAVLFPAGRRGSVSFARRRGVIRAGFSAEIIGSTHYGAGTFRFRSDHRILSGRVARFAGNRKRLQRSAFGSLLRTCDD